MLEVTTAGPRHHKTWGAINVDSFQESQAVMFVPVWKSVTQLCQMVADVSLVSNFHVHTIQPIKTLTRNASFVQHKI